MDYRADESIDWMLGRGLLMMLGKDIQSSPFFHTTPDSFTHLLLGFLTAASADVCPQKEGNDEQSCIRDRHGQARFEDT